MFELLNSNSARLKQLLALALNSLILALMLGLVSNPATTKAADASTKTVATQVVATYNWGEILESVALDRDGNTYVSLSLSGQIRKITPNGTQTTLASLPVGTGGIGQQPGILGTLAIGSDGMVYASLASSDATANGIWRISQQGVAQRIVALPVGAMPNGITFDYFGNLFVADSALGQIWRIGKGEQVAQVWLKDSLLAPQGGNGFPGANGIKFYLDKVYVTNSSTGNIVRVGFQANGQPTTPTVYATGVHADDFAFDLLGNIYATTHPFNTIVRVQPDGQQVVIATPAQGVIGPTSVAFGTVNQDRLNLYTVTDGGFFGSLFDPNSPTGLPSLVRLQINLPGYPLV